MKNQTFTAREYFSLDTTTPLKPTGRQETYSAPTYEKAALNLLYTRQLSNGSAVLGPTGRVVYSNDKTWVLS